MPASKDPKFTKSVLLQARVIPEVKERVDRYIEFWRKQTGKDYGYPEFVREAIEEKLVLLEKTLSNLEHSPENDDYIADIDFWKAKAIKTFEMSKEALKQIKKLEKRLIRESEKEE